MRVGLFGGSFDPVHLGHLLIAESALETLSLDQVRWIPAATSPLKRGGPVASDADRLEMLRLAIDGADGHLIDECELTRGEVSYTVDTLMDLHRRFADADFYFIIGSDSLATWRQWRSPQRIMELAHLAVVQRGGEPAADFSPLEGLATQEQIANARRNVIPMPAIELSSSDLRSRIAAGRGIRFRTPRGVEDWILSRGLYRMGGGSE